jgi:hypothetical protein
MEFSEYENIEIFNNTQSFDINKCENQILRRSERIRKRMVKLQNPSIGLAIKDNIDINYIFDYDFKLSYNSNKLNNKIDKNEQESNFNLFCRCSNFSNQIIPEICKKR